MGVMIVQVIRESRMIRFIKWLCKLTVITFSLILLVASLTILALLYLRSQPLPPHHIQETTVVYAADGQMIDQIHQGQNRTHVPIEHVPPHLLQAFLAVEDQRFYSHYGFDLKRIAGAAVANVRNRSYSEGASTITQQLARNLYLDHSKTWERKLREAVYTIQLEMHFSKTDIFEKYINQIYFGHGAYGVESAAQTFFGKSATELSLAESALIAGVPKGPRYYSPLLNLDRSLARQELILHLMHEQGFITTAEYNEALNEDLIFVSADDVQGAGQMAPYFRDFVRQIAIQHYDIEEEVFDQGGLRIYTTLDSHMQKKAEQIMMETLPEDRPLQGALVAIDPKNGHIKAMVGGKDYLESQYNRVLASRHPGSSLKPFLYYSALEHGLTPLTLMKSEPTTFEYDDGRQSWTPTNFNDRYPNDYITMEQAIASSDNIYAVKTHLFLGEQTLVDTLQRFGFNHEFRPYPSLALGAQNVNLLELVKGYSTFANEGRQAMPMAITHIEDRQGNILVSEEPKVSQVLDPAHTFILNRMLRSVFEPGGTGYRVSSQLTRPVAGKTGSTDTDGWMIGYTPQLVAGVWVGYDQERKINHNNDGRLAADMWAEFIEAALENQMPALFTAPEGVVGAYINPDNGKLATEHCPEKRLLYFKEGTEPTQFCDVHIPDPDMIPDPLQMEESSFWEKIKDWFGE